MHASVEELLAYREGELENVGVMQNHIRQCDACQQSLNQLSEIGQQLRDLPAHQVPASTWQTIAQEIRTSNSASLRKRWPANRVFQPLAACIAAVGFAIVLVLFQRQPPAPLNNLDELIAESRELEHQIADYQRNSDAMTARQQMRIDQQHWKLLILDQQLTQTDTLQQPVLLETLWRQRIETLNNLHNVLNMDDADLLRPVARNLL